MLAPTAVVFGAGAAAELLGGTVVFTTQASSTAEAIEAGLISSEKLAGVLGAMEQGFAATAPQNAVGALNVVSKAVASVGLETGIASGLLGARLFCRTLVGS